MPPVFSKPSKNTIYASLKSLDHDEWWPEICSDDLPVPEGREGLWPWRREDPPIIYIYYIKNGEIVAVLTYFPINIIRGGKLTEERGNFNIMTHRDHRKRGYGAALLKCLESTDLYIRPYKDQILTRDGAALIAKVHPELNVINLV
jgi:GNAT superfamily N-acetyltransferase